MNNQRFGAKFVGETANPLSVVAVVVLEYLIPCPYPPFEMAKDEYR
jgi:hypothetical protein